MSDLIPASSRALALLFSSLRRIIERLGPGTVLAVAVAAAGLLYSLNRRGGTTTRARRPASRRGSRRPGGLSGVQRVTMGLEVGGDVLNNTGDLSVDVIPVLGKFAKLFDLYVIVRAESDEWEDKISAVFQNAEVSGFDLRKLVFCDTVDGRVSMVRQIDPHLHIDESESVVSSLQRFIRHVAFVSSTSASTGASASSAAGTSKSNVLKYSSLAQFF